MIIITKNETIVRYSVDINYFDENTDVSCTSSTGSHWQTAESNAYTLSYNFAFSAEDRISRKKFIDFLSRFTITFKLENERSDISALLNMINEHHHSIESFIENNSLSYFNMLDLSTLKLTSTIQEQLIKGLTRIKYGGGFEKKSEFKKEMDKKISEIIINF